MELLLIIGVIALPFIIIWMLAVGDLMTRRDDDFRGQSDKLAWAIILTFTGIFGAIVYFFCGRSEQNARTSNSTEDGATAEDQFECMECGATIPAGAAKCSSCGWSYSES